MTEIDEVVAFGLDFILNNASFEDRAKIFSDLDSYFRNATRKKSTPDLEAKVEAFSQRIQKLAFTAKFKVNLEASRVIIMSDDDVDNETLMFLERGTDWFEGRDIGNGILESLTNASSYSK